MGAKLAAELYAEPDVVPCAMAPRVHRLDSIAEPVKRVLLVEDDVHLSEILRLHLRADSYAVDHASDGRQAPT